MSFLTSVRHILDLEKGFVNHPADPGGATNFGITIAVLAEWRGHPVTVEDVRNLKRDEAIQIYKAFYWDRARCDSMPPSTALLVFDGAVNHGVSRSAKILQEALGVPADGRIGPRTLAAATAMEPKALLTEVAARRMHFYATLPGFLTFGLGWSRRLMSTFSVAMSER
jgi:lysozyme family protein